MTVNKTLGPMAMEAVKISGGRTEEWRVTFSGSIDIITDSDIMEAMNSVTWLWSPKICRTSSNTVIYTGYTD